MENSLSINREFFVEAHSRAIDSCTEPEELRNVSKSLLRAWQMQAMFSEQYGAEVLGIKRP